MQNLCDFKNDQHKKQCAALTRQLKLDLRIGEPMQICIHRKDNSPKPVNHRLTLKEGPKVKSNIIRFPAHNILQVDFTLQTSRINNKRVISTLTVFALERDFASLYTLWGELSQNQLTNASVLSLPGETLKTDGRNSSIIGSDDVHISS